MGIYCGTCRITNAALKAVNKAKTKEAIEDILEKIEKVRRFAEVRKDMIEKGWKITEYKGE